MIAYLISNTAKIDLLVQCCLVNVITKNIHILIWPKFKFIITFYLFMIKYITYTLPTTSRIVSISGIASVFLSARSMLQPPEGFICVTNNLASSILEKT